MAQQGGKIDRIEIEDFKSYQGKHSIGPLKEFTCVIGPNGSGKSNLMDAISFVLGVRTAQLRGSLSELLYSDSASSSPSARPRRGQVTLVYEAETGDKTRFSRVISPSSSTAQSKFTSQYRVNDRNVTWDAYNAKLEGFGILVKARNFLVFQVCWLQRRHCVCCLEPLFHQDNALKSLDCRQSTTSFLKRAPACPSSF